MFLALVQMNLPLHRLAAVLHQQPDGSWGSVELSHLIFVHHIPHAAHVWVSGHPLKLKQR